MLKLVLLPPILLLALYLRFILFSFSIVRNLVSLVLSEAFSRVLGLESSVRYRAQESAVLIVGVVDNVGQGITMRFSELGYTVFALCPSHPKGTSDTISSHLLYDWHLKKRESPHLLWGTIAPISLDLSSNSDRLHAYETVQAYCSNHSVRLVALLSLPHPTFCGPRHGNLGARLGGDGSQEPMQSAYLSLSTADEELWHKVIIRDIAEPALITQDYIKMLRESCGRVVILSGCSSRCQLCAGLTSLVDDGRQMICQTLRDELKPLGIAVASIFSSPVVACLHDTRYHNTRPGNALEGFKHTRLNMSMERSRKRIEPLVRFNIIPALAPHLGWLPRLAVQEADIFSVIMQIIHARNPRLDHVIGVSVLFSRILKRYPATMGRLVRQAMYDS